MSTILPDLYKIAANAAISSIDQTILKPEVIDKVRETALEHYHRAPRMWTITTFVLAVYAYGYFGRYDVHYYERGGTDFVRVHDRVLGTVIYRHPDDSCTTSDDDGQ